MTLNKRAAVLAQTLDGLLRNWRCYTIICHVISNLELLHNDL
jgi:hypothetical protein